ncbi:MAG: autotransporter domain-containing protein, partial [Xanthobacteraceae bacterium]
TSGGTFSGVLADGGVGGGTKGSLIVAGGTETLSGTNTYTGDTTINPGATLALLGTGSISNSSPVIDNGTFDITQTSLGTAITSLSGSGKVYLGSQMLVITAGAAGASGTNAAGVFSGVIADAGGIGGGIGGMLAVSGGTQTLSGVNTYTGPTLINSGATLALQGNGAIASSSIVIDNGAFDISLTTTGASITTLTGTGTAALGSKTLTITAGSTTFAGAITDSGLGGGTGGNLHIGGGTQTLTGTNTYTGTTTIDPGAKLALSGTGSIADSSNVIANGLFDISQTSLGASIQTLSGSGNVALGANLLLITKGSTTFSGIIADGGGAVPGTGGMLAVGGGTQTLSGVNTYTGATLINSGATLALSNNGSIATSAVVVDNGTFDISQTNAGASIKTLMGSGQVGLGGQELTITNGSTTFSGVIADGGILTAAGQHGSLIVSGGTQTLAGVNTYTGDTTIAPTSGTATLALTGAGSIATSSKVAIATGGTFDISQTSAGASIMTLADSGAGQSGKVALGAQTLTITNGSTTFSGAIADGGIGGGSGGNLTVTGGTQTLAGANTYTGLTTIAPTSGTATLALTGNGSIATSSGVSVATNGTFDISGTTSGASIATLSGSGSVVLGSQFLTLTAAAAGPNGTSPAGIFSGGISGLGGMAITGGHEELTGVNTYQGGTTVTNGAVLSINGPSSLGAATSTLTLNNGTLVADASITIPQPVTLLGAPPGADVINLNSNKVTLSGAINGPGVLDAINGGTLNLTGTVNSIGGLVLGPGTTLTTSASASAGLATTPIVLVPTSGTPVGLFTGSVHVVGPLDVVNGAPTTELIIVPGATLEGVGGVNVPIVFQGGGTNAPGDGPGTIVVNASVTNLPNSIFTVEIDGPLPSATNCTVSIGCKGQYSATYVTGAGNTYTAGGAIAPVLTGISPPASNLYIPPVTTSFTVVYAPAGVLGSFASLTQPAAGVPNVSGGLAPGTRFDALYFNAASSLGSGAFAYAAGPTAIDLWVTPANYQNLSYWNVNLNQNQSQVASALNALRGPAGVKNSNEATWDFGNLFPQQPQALPGIFSTLSGEVNTGAQQSSFQIMRQFLALMLDPTVNRRSVSVGDGSSAIGFAPDGAMSLASNDQDTPLSRIAAAYDSVLKAPATPTFDQRWSAWGTAFGGVNKTNGDLVVGTTNVTASTYGYAAGINYNYTPDSVVGFALAAGGTNWGLAQGLGTGRSDVFQAGIYGTMHSGPAYVYSALAFANNWMSTSRIAFGGDQLAARFNAQNYGGRIETGYRLAALQTTGVSPFAAVQAQYFHAPSFGETDSSGGGFGLNYDAAGATDITSQIGARVDSLQTLHGMPLMLRAWAAWEHDWVSNPALTATFQAALAPGALPGASASFMVNGAALPANSAVASASAELRVTPSVSLTARFDSQLAVGSQYLGGTGTLRYTW